MVRRRMLVAAADGDTGLPAWGFRPAALRAAMVGLLEEVLSRGCRSGFAPGIEHGSLHPDGT